MPAKFICTYAVFCGYNICTVLIEKKGRDNMHLTCVYINIHTSVNYWNSRICDIGIFYWYNTVTVLVIIRGGRDFIH